MSTVWGCPYEGEVDPNASLSITRKLLELGCYQVSLGDTIGVGTPLVTKRLVSQFLAELSAPQLALHFHDTRGTALANVLTALHMGVTTFDSSAGGLGGCPYAPGATGNLATEDLVYMLDGLGIESGVKLAAVVEVSAHIEPHVGHRLPSRYYRAVSGHCLAPPPLALSELLAPQSVRGVRPGFG